MGARYAWSMGSHRYTRMAAAACHKRRGRDTRSCPLRAVTHSQRASTPGLRFDYPRPGPGHPLAAGELFKFSQDRKSILVGIIGGLNLAEAGVHVRVLIKIKCLI